MLTMDIIDLKAVFATLWNHPVNVMALSSFMIVVYWLLRYRNHLHNVKILLSGRESNTDKYSLDGREADGFENEQQDNAEDETFFPEEIGDIAFQPARFSSKDMIVKSNEFHKHINQRRSCRQIGSDTVPREVIDNIIKAAGTSPSGAHTQPWTYVVVADTEVKQKIREIIEHEEYINYSRRMGEQWVKDLHPLKTNWEKPYLTEAPFIILLFRQVHGYWKDGRKRTHYYGEISAAISAGFLLLAIHHAGLVTVTTTPMNCGPSLRKLLNRPNTEKLLLLFPVGLPPPDARVPDLNRKPLEQYMIMI